MNNILRVGTDCSGIEAPIQALLQLKIPFRHVFSSDIDKYCIQSIKANYEPEIIFGDKEGSFPDGDITKRNIKDVPDIDLYVCGFPCQPFSIAGERKGFEDKRGNVFFSCLEVIEVKQPKYFILENVKGLKSHDKGNTWKVIWKYILGLEKYGYIVKWKILNTRDYGIPQNRERVFIVGVKDKEFDWSEKKDLDDLRNYVDYEDRNSRPIPDYCVGLFNNIPNNSVFVNLCFLKYSKFPTSHIICPTISASNNLWNVKLSRYANIKENLLLQGFPLNFKQVVYDSQLKKQIGNSMSVNVLKCLFEKILLP